MQNRLTLGIICVVVGAAVFSVQDAVIKAISGGYPVTEAIAIRAIVALPILSLLVHFDSGLGKIVSPRFGWLTLRAVIMGAFLGGFNGRGVDRVEFEVQVSPSVPVPEPARPRSRRNGNRSAGGG